MEQFKFDLVHLYNVHIILHTFLHPHFISYSQARGAFISSVNNNSFMVWYTDLKICSKIPPICILQNNTFSTLYARIKILQRVSTSLNSMCFLCEIRIWKWYLLKWFFVLIKNLFKIWFKDQISKIFFLCGFFMIYITLQSCLSGPSYTTWPLFNKLA